MTHQFAGDHAQDHSLQRLCRRLIAEWVQGHAADVPDGPRLVMFNPDAPVPGFDLRHDPWRGIGLRIAGTEPEADLLQNENRVARTSSVPLALQSSSVGAVLLGHLITHGEEEVLAEACRIVQPAGFVLVLGLNRLGLRHLADRNSCKAPGMSPLAVRAQLEKLEMNVITTLAAGFLGGNRPEQLNRGLARMLIPLADVLLIVARPVTPKIMNPLTESKKMRAVGVPSALAGR